MKTIFVDTNAFLRVYLEDVPTQAERAKRLFKQAEQRNVSLTTNSQVVFECVYGLQKLYRKSKQEIIEFVLQLLGTPNLYVEQHEILLQAIDIFRDHSIDFVDAYNTAWTQAHGVGLIFRFDRDYRKVRGIKLIS